MIGFQSMQYEVMDSPDVLIRPFAQTLDAPGQALVQLQAALVRNLKEQVCQGRAFVDSIA